MLLLVAIVLGVAWVFGVTVYHLSSALIHVLLLLALGSAVLHFVRERRATRPTGP